MTGEAEVSPDTPGVQPRRFSLAGSEYVVDGLPLHQVEQWRLLTRDGLAMTEREFEELPETMRIELHAQVELYLMSVSGG